MRSALRGTLRGSRWQMDGNAHPDRWIESSAPTRVCDLGGWTDTWFAQYGRVLNLAVQPSVHVHLRASRCQAEPRITLNAQEVGEAYEIDVAGKSYGPCPLLEATIRSAAVPWDLHLHVRVQSDAPPGSSMGTSAAACVALIAALDRLRLGSMTSHDIARAAHRIETEALGQQSGIQDQIAAAHGGVSYIEVDPYPHARVTMLPLSKALLGELEHRLCSVFVGQAHCSSAVHERVIQSLAGAGPDNPHLARLRRLAEQGRDALLQGDLNAFGRVMTENTDAQAELHSSLIGERHRRIIEAAHRLGATGWKVNGAGGEGGSVTILRQPGVDPTEMDDAMAAAVEGARVIPMMLNMVGVQARIRTCSPTESPLAATVLDRREAHAS